MNDYERENMVAWGRMAAAYTNKDAGLLEYMAIDSFIEAEHTRYVVGERTGDMRLARMAGHSALAQYWLRAFLITAIPAAVFAAGCFVLYVLGKGLGISPGVLCAVWFVPCLVLCLYVAVRTASMRNGEYIRANLPDERTLNRAGYYEVEPGVWFNMVTNRVLEGACYRPTEQAVRRSAGRSEEQAIRDLYRTRQQWQGTQQAITERDR
jgi:hypothetical protein